MERKKVPIKINIAGYQLPLEVELDEQDSIRDSEKRVNAIFASWQKRYPHKKDSELLAMLTFRYASFYYSRQRSEQELNMEIDGATEALASILPDEV